MPTLKDIMSAPPVTIGENESISTAAKLMTEKNIGCLVVASPTEEDDRISAVGIITERDLMTRVVAADKSPHETTVNQVMTAPVYTLESDSLVEDASALMNEKNVRRLPVSEGGHVVGVITMREVHRWLQFGILKKLKGI